MQYADYAVWQREWLRGDGAGRAGRLLAASSSAGAPPLELPTDRPRPPVSDRGAAPAPVAVAAGVDGGARAQLARREGATLFMALLAAFEALLRRYTGQDDIVVGTPIAGPHRAEIEGLIGFFVNTLVAARPTSRRRPDASASCSARRARDARWRRTPIRTCRSSSSSRSCSRSATWRARRCSR